MVINDKLKGEFYRTPMTKLASRRNIVNKLNELIDYFNNISEFLNKSFDHVTDERKKMINDLVKTQEQILHFRHILSNFNAEIDQHIYEKLNQTIESFDNVVIQFTNKYSDNLFDHNGAMNDRLNSSNSNILGEWDKSVNSLSSTLGIQWYGGKISEKSILNELNNVLHIIKMNNYEGNKHEDYINSNIILEVFIYTSNGMAWLVLGENGLYGHNFYVKYQTPNMNYDIRLAGKTFNTRKEYDLNRVDFDFILSDIVGSSNGDVYIKFCTNIPANNESGKCAYMLNGINSFKCYENLRTIIDFTNGSLYQDNKDLAYYQQDGIYLKNLINTGVHINTINIVNLVEKNYPIQSIHDDELEEYHSYLHSMANNKSTKYTISTINPVGKNMKTTPEEYSGIVVDNFEDVINVGYISSNAKINNSIKDNPDYINGDININLLDHRTVGDVSMMMDSEELLVVEDVNKNNKPVSDCPFEKYDTTKTVLKNWASNDTKTINKIDYRKNFIKNIFNINESTIENRYIDLISESTELKLSSNMLIGSFKRSGLFYSEDGGETWIQSNVTSGSFEEIHKSNNGVIITGAYYKDEINRGESAYYSEDNGKTWNKSGGAIVDVDITDMIITNDGTIIAASNTGPNRDSNGIYYSVDNGKSFIESSGVGLSTMPISLLQLNDGVIIAKDQNDTRRILYSNDNGRTWSEKRTAYEQYLNFIQTEDDTIIAFGIRSYNKKCRFSIDNCETWTKCNFDGVTEEDYMHIYSVTKTYNGMLVCGTDSGIWYSKDNGRNWYRSNITYGSFSEAIFNDGVIIISDYSDSGISELRGIFYSEDGGETWTQSNPTSFSLKSFVKTDDAIIGYVYYSCYKSQDYGKTWTKIVSNMNNVAYTTLFYSSEPNFSPIKNTDIIELGKYRIFNHWKGIMYYDTEFNEFTLTSYNNSYEILSHCQVNDSTLYLGTKTGILKVELNISNEIVFNKTNIIGGEFGAFAKFTDDFIYAFRIKTNIYVKRTDGGIGNNRYFLRDFMYVLYNGTWYEFNDLCENILGINESEIEKISYSNGPLELFSTQIEFTNFIHKLSENSAVLFKNLHGSVGSVVLVGDTIKNIRLPLVRINTKWIHQFTSTDNYYDRIKLPSDSRLIISQINNKWLIASAINATSKWKYFAYNIEFSNIRELYDGWTESEKTHLYTSIFLIKHRMRSIPYINGDKIEEVANFIPNAIFVALSNDKYVFVKDDGTIKDVLVGPNNLLYIIKTTNNVTIADLNAKICYDSFLKKFIVNLEDDEDIQFLYPSVFVKDDLMLLSTIGENNNNVKCYLTTVIYPLESKRSSISIGFTANQLKK